MAGLSWPCTSPYSKWQRLWGKHPNMISPKQKIPQSELSGRLQSLMLLRVIFVSLLLGASIFVQVKETQTYFGHIQTSHYLLIAIIYALTFAYAVIFKYSRNLLWFAYLQLFFDTIFITAFIFTTGGIESIFSSLYNLCIIYGSIMLYRKGGMIVASCSSILYGLLLDLHYYGVIYPLGTRLSYPEGYQSSHLFFTILVNIVAFYVVAYLSSYVSEKARSTDVELRAKQVDVDNLEILNESIINSITSALIALDGSDRIILFNPAAEEIFGLRANDVFGSRVEQELPFLSDYLPQDEAISSSPGTRRLTPFIDILFLKPNSGKMHLQLFISPLHLMTGGQRGRILVFQDMTQIKRIEEEMKRVEGLALIGELAAGIAHEIKNPMASISGSIQILRNGQEIDDVNRRLMDIVSREIDRLNNLVNDFLVFARPKKANSKEFDLSHLITEALELFKNSRHWNEKVDIHTDFRYSIKIHSDPEQIRQVLWNLFLNASEAMPEGGKLHVMTDLSRAELKSDQEHAKIVVRDTGKGFSREALPRLFTPFFTTKEKGSGLGLAIVKGIVEGLNGKISADNHPEGGAEVSMWFPLYPPHQSPSGKNTRPPHLDNSYHLVG